MQIGEVIRKYRKERNLTQEEMVNRLGVTAPAVNKWENANSLPDVLLLAPIARLLGKNDTRTVSKLRGIDLAVSGHF
jgi:transcriptional regulator with XRE-family HTH domain